MSEPLYAIRDSRRLDRRAFLAVTNSLLAAAAWSNRATGKTLKRAAFADYPFQLGVASGDPSPDGIVLWTRLAPKPMAGGGMPDEAIEVAWQVAEDERMSKVVRQGTTVANPEWAHAVHVEVNGLRPDRWYFYQFKAGGETSPKGRTRTVPAADRLSERLRLAFASCQHFEAGYFTAYEHMAHEDLDLVLHLGDYIYEGAGKAGGVRRHEGSRLETLEQYRLRHAQYRSDPALSAMHAAVPWIVTWDDHEVANNYAGLTSESSDESVEAMRKRRAAAYRAYYEHMPLRACALPNGPDMKLYRRLAFGRLVDFHVLDTRQYRTDQPCGDGNKAPCESAYDPQATLLGPEQRDWLFGGLKRSAARWNVLAQQVMMARADFTPGEAITHSMDQWPGYEADRRRVLKYFHDEKIVNPIVLTGDIHSNWANELIADFDNLDSRCVATEFVGTSITSGGDGVKEVKNLSARLAENPFVKFHNARRGYVRCEISPTEWRSDYQTVEYVSRRGAPVATSASFVVESGRPTLERA